MQAVQDAMKNPEIAAQAQQMAAAMQNQQLQQRMAQLKVRIIKLRVIKQTITSCVLWHHCKLYSTRIPLRVQDDPELAGMFEDIQYANPIPLHTCMLCDFTCILRMPVNRACLCSFALLFI